jgi:hypothetical protein
VPVNLGELLVDLVAEALDLLVQRPEPFGDRPDRCPQAFEGHVHMAAKLRGAGLNILAKVLASLRGAGLDFLAKFRSAGLDVLAEFLAEVLSKPIGAGFDILAKVLSKPIEPGVERVLSHADSVFASSARVKSIGFDTSTWVGLSPPAAHVALDEHRDLSLGGLPSGDATHDLFQFSRVGGEPMGV